MDLDAIRRTHDDLMLCLYSGKPADAKTGIPEVDALLPYVEDDSATGRGHFLAGVLEASLEPPNAGEIRGRQSMADKATQCLVEAAQLLKALDNASTSVALEELARVVKALSATERLHVVIDSNGIAPGMRALVTHQPTHRSTLQAGGRGKASHRANVIRRLARPLTPTAPLSAIARLVTAATGLECSHADVGQAIGRQQSAGDESTDFGLQSAWGKPPPA